MRYHVVLFSFDDTVTCIVPVLRPLMMDPEFIVRQNLAEQIPPIAKVSRTTSVTMLSARMHVVISTHFAQIGAYGPLFLVLNGKRP